MVTLKNIECRSGWLMIELMTAVSILVLALLPFAYSFAAEKRLARSQYQRAVAMEIVDGELEVLAAGEWRAYQPGRQPYTVSARSLPSLPPGSFTLNIDSGAISLEWVPKLKKHGGSIYREVKLK